LWEISARVKEQIEAQMTPEQKEYWAAQGGYFEQVMMIAQHGNCMKWYAVTPLPMLVLLGTPVCHAALPSAAARWGAKCSSNSASMSSQ
jgi:hypothetical protein